MDIFDMVFKDKYSEKTMGKNETDDRIPIYCQKCEERIFILSRKFLETGKKITVMCHHCSMQTVIIVQADGSVLIDAE
jgi:hypothetical protein